MADKLFTLGDGVSFKRLKDMGDGTFAEVVSIADQIGRSGFRIGSQARKRIYGQSGNASGTYCFQHTMQAPGPFDAIQIVLTGAASSGSNAFKVSAASSATYNNGYDPKTSANVDIAYTPITFGATDKDDFRNPGGGAATTLIQNASGSGVALIEGNVISDIVPNASLARTDDPTKPELLMLRLYGTNAPAVPVGELNSGSTNPFTNAEPEFFSGYWTVDYTGSKPPGPPNLGFIPNIEVIFYLRGQVVRSMAFASDSIGQGWVALATVPQWGGNINGWTRKFVAKLQAAGIRSSYTNLCHTGDKSQLFHNRAYNALLSGGLSHLFIQPWSVNEVADGISSVAPALARTSQLISLAIRKGVRPILVRPWAGQIDSTNAIGIAINTYLDAAAKSGIAVLDARSIVASPTASEAINPAYLTRNSGGGIVDTVHLNEAGHDAVAQFAFDTRQSYGL